VHGPVSDDGFSVVFSSYRADILRFARRRTDSDDAAWDVVSDTFTSAWRNWSRRPGEDALLPWLYAIAANAVRDRHRAAGRQRRLASRLSMLQPEPLRPDLADEVLDREALAAAFARLAPADREVLMLVGWEGLTDARAIGLVLGLRPGAVRGRVHRARRRLRELLASADDPPAEAAEPTAASQPSHRVSEA
jgi:RNA polymerase sigma-70 factor, ECF subfamily